MSKIYSIQSIHDDLKKRIEYYIETEYLGKNKALRNACHEMLTKNGVLSKNLMVEANCGYELSKTEIYNSELPENIKEIIKTLVEANIGFFKYPYLHQKNALEDYFRGNDLLVSTGTGSGKTECFLWPMVSSIVNEAKNKPSWNCRGVRAIILYPMNALVSDQISRLRKMIGDYDDNFLNTFINICGNKRRPQFGMYTGRTKYSGDHSNSKDKEYADTLEMAYLSYDLNDDEKIKTISKLKSLGKYPAKKSLRNFVDMLNQGKHCTDPLDAELLTRFEMRKTCPDILITNYSMLDLMMVREEEKNIWEETANWLCQDQTNKLLFIIDEAHMYKGSAGAEVALLIKRFMTNLNIDRSKVNFILTSASFPKDSMEAVYKFACDLTNESYENHSFKFITGQPKKFQSRNLMHLYIPDSFECNFYDLYDSEKKYETIDKAFLDLNIELDEHPTTEEDLGDYLFRKLPTFGQIVELIEFTRGNAKSVSEITKHIFKNTDEKVATKVTEFLLALLPMAKNKSNQVLFPTRIHMMFRGITGIYACSNPKCKNKNHSLPFGKLFINEKRYRCDCGGKIYELVNERSCGALFFKAYELKTQSNFLWNSQVYNNDLVEVSAYIPEDLTELSNRIISKKDNDFCFLNPFTGKLFFNPNENDSFLPILLIRKEKNSDNEGKTFVCPKCEKRSSIATDFSTKGNEPFYNLISEQFNLQPMVITDPDILKVSPNGGRKVLVFSDSRNKAARLALDLTRTADRDAFRKILILAIKNLQESAEYYGYKPTMDLLYPTFIHMVILKKVKLFYGQERENLNNLVNDITKCIFEYEDNGIINYSELNRECDNRISAVYQEEILYHICSNFTSLTDLKMCYIEPSPFVLRKFKQSELFKNGRFSEEEFKKIYAAWMDYLLTDYLALDKTIETRIRMNVRPGVQRFGYDGSKFTKRVLGLLNSRLNDPEIAELFSIVEHGLESANNLKYLQLSKNILVYNEEKEWYKCPRCGCFFPYEFEGKCMKCGIGKVNPIVSDDLDGIKFYTQPVYSELKKSNKERILTINTMEHTAQLNSSEESEDKIWTNAENYEMRFQDLILNNEEPIDVLSCTTTMEVGVDIGALTAIGLRDVPPLVENYQQRVGRSGRRGTSISTIVTYVENGPHDNYYFNHPEEIISGDLRRPWIDVNNPKLIGRHLSLTIINKFLLSKQKSLYKLRIDVFCEEFLEDVLNYIKIVLQDKTICDSLIPFNSAFDKVEYFRDLKNKLENLQIKVKTYPEQFRNEHYAFMSALDVLVQEGIFPNYSFPRDVVSFYIQDPKNPNNTLNAPSRSMDIALNEYAPGKLVVVNKNTYRVGGLYMKGKNNFYTTGNYLNSKEYYKKINCCTNKLCNWMDEEKPNRGLCPFCHSEVIEKDLIKPWGFAPTNGTPEVDAAKNDSYSTSGTPVYAIISDDRNMCSINNYSNIRVENKYNQKIAIVNKGYNSNGFSICKKCGGAVLNLMDGKTKHNIQMPFKSASFVCNHNDRMDAYLGSSDIITDMALFQVIINPDKVECSYDGFWLKKAATTLEQAIILAASKLLDIDYNELRGGFRTRKYNQMQYLEFFIFDSLTSGAGYSQIVSKRASEILDIAYIILTDCNCTDSCHNCLENFYNQSEAHNFDRFKGLELLAYIKNNICQNNCHLINNTNIVKH